jgi:Zn-dependent protease with chaperone function
MYCLPQQYVGLLGNACLCHYIWAFMRISGLILSTVILFTSVLQAQLPDGWTRLQDDTLVNARFRAHSQKLKSEKLASLPNNFRSDYQKMYATQFEEIDQFWQGRRAITDSALSSYVGRVTEIILGANPQLRDPNLRIAVTRDWWPNAYSLGDGTIGINAGLFVYLENEAQLAFIICHELAHYQLDHTGRSIRQYVETINSESYQRELKRLKNETYRVNQQLEALADKFVWSSRRHRREHEAEADRMALGWLRNTGYDLQAVESCLRLLNRIDDSTHYAMPALQSVFDFPEYPFRQRWVQEESKIFAALDESKEDQRDRDSLRTHPDCDQRIELLRDSIQGGGKIFLADEAAFHQWKKGLLPEMLEYSFQRKKLSRNLYLGLQLLQDEKYSRYAAYSVARCLNLLYEQQQRHLLGKVIDTEGPEHSVGYNLLLRLLGRIRLQELANLSFHFCRKHKEHVMDWPEFVKEAKLAESRAKAN